MDIVLTEGAVAVLAEVPARTQVLPLVARRRAAALRAVAEQIARRHDLPTLDHLDPVGDGELVLAQVATGDLPALARWAAAYAQPITVSVSDNAAEHWTRHCSVEIGMWTADQVVRTTLRIWTVVRPPTGVAEIDRLVGLYLGDRVDASGELVPPIVTAVGR